MISSFVIDDDCIVLFNLTGISGLICLESDNECEGSSPHGNPKEKEAPGAQFGVARNSKAGFFESASSFGRISESNYVGLCSPSEVVLEGADGEKFESVNEKSEFLYDCGGMTSKNDLDVILKMKDNISRFASPYSDVAAVCDYSLPGTADIIQIVGDSPVRDGCEDVIHQVFLSGFTLMFLSTVY